MNWLIDSALFLFVSVLYWILAFSVVKRSYKVAAISNAAGIPHPSDLKDINFYLLIVPGVLSILLALCFGCYIFTHQPLYEIVYRIGGGVVVALEMGIILYCWRKPLPVFHQDH